MESRGRAVTTAGAGASATGAAPSSSSSSTAVVGRQQPRAAREAFLKKYERPGLMVDEVEEMKEAFDLFDMDGTGRVAPRDVQAAIQSLG